MGCVDLPEDHHPLAVFFFFNDTATTEIYTLSPRRSSDLQSNSSSPASSTNGVICGQGIVRRPDRRSEEHTSELQSRSDLVCRLLLEKKKKKIILIQFTKKKKKKKHI